ncbi:hypothetical protein GCM10025868_06590 [Angustibacter aerolatus]|uniref:Uncharacterized protein n=1 Tax=Angustibacter aerolatus TaxID=1162965 RepID=A0ABQ6JC91_9ACTN|nr:hypothetical protein GCM10025868_06590 [Angustibacter aerolatus]
MGQAQRNKVASVVRYAAAVHSVDRSRLVTALADAVERADRDLDVLLQVDLGGGAQRPGAPAAASTRPTCRRSPSASPRRLGCTCAG